MAPDQPNAPPELRHALDTIDRIVTQRITHARVPTTTRPANPAHQHTAEPRHARTLPQCLLNVTHRTGLRITAPKAL